VRTRLRQVIKANNYACTTDQELLRRRWEDTVCVFTRQQHSSAWNDVIAAILKSWRQIKKFRLRRSMCIYLKNIPVKLHPDSIWNDEAVSFSKRSISQSQCL